jgi:hypothetical protein
MKTNKIFTVTIIAIIFCFFSSCKQIDDAIEKATSGMDHYDGFQYEAVIYTSSNNKVRIVFSSDSKGEIEEMYKSYIVYINDFIYEVEGEINGRSEWHSSGIKTNVKE